MFGWCEAPREHRERDRDREGEREGGEQRAAVARARARDHTSFYLPRTSLRGGTFHSIRKPIQMYCAPTTAGQVLLVVFGGRSLTLNVCMAGGPARGSRPRRRPARQWARRRQVSPSLPLALSLSISRALSLCLWYTHKYPFSDSLPVYLSVYLSWPQP